MRHSDKLGLIHQFAGDELNQLFIYAATTTPEHFLIRLSTVSVGLATLYPGFEFFAINADRRRILHRIIGANDVKKLAVARGLAVGNDDPVKRLFFRPFWSNEYELPLFSILGGYCPTVQTAGPCLVKEWGLFIERAPLGSLRRLPPLTMPLPFQIPIIFSIMV